MDAERDALVALYRATNGDRWFGKEGWCTGAPLLEWYGVKVSDGRVVELNLYNNNLRGSIPKELRQFDALTSLNLGANRLEGSIPKELGQLGALTELKLGSNQLEGSIPKELGQLGALTDLNLGRNQLEGSIPTELGKLSALEIVWLQKNKLEGSIPTELGKLSALGVLNLSNNKLEDDRFKRSEPFRELSDRSHPTCFEQRRMTSEHGFPTVRYLRSSGNCVLFEYLISHTTSWKMTALSDLNLSGNFLTGSIPTELRKLSALGVLNLSNNKLEGSISTELGKLRALRVLDLSYNKLEVLPLAIAVAFSNVKQSLLENPWSEPPSDVVRQGSDAVIRYWEDIETYGRDFSNRLKVVLVGLGSAGKTSLAIRLEGRDGDSLPTEDERTVGVEIRDIRLQPSPVSRPKRSGQDLAVKLWDFAGQRAYYDTHQIFLTKDALYILVVDISTYEVGHTREDAIEQWIDIIQSRVPGAVVLLVGTHKDALPNADLCEERMKKLHQDVKSCLSRLREELGARKQGHGIQEVRIVNGDDVFLLNCKSSEEDEINRLRSLIATVAYDRPKSFPSVESQIPTPWVYAFLTLESIRHGADLHGVSGNVAAVKARLKGADSRTGKYYVFFNEALAIFKELWKPTSSEEAHQVFYNSIGLFETQGLILLTNRDGSVDDESIGQVNRDQLILHVDPVRFADVVRRIVDIRLVDSANKPKVRAALKAFAREMPDIRLSDLSDQQTRFYMAGEVDKNYLKFLWNHRELDLGQATQEAPPLDMTEEDVDAMVRSLVDLRMMFPVRKGSGDVSPDRYFIGACLPDHIRGDVTPESFLELKVGSAMFRLVLEINGTGNMPPGLIPRLLAWCGRGKGRITACWRHGGCFTYNGHLVLIYERSSERQSSIVCCVKGESNTEKAEECLKDVAKEVDSLICDPRYGFPGIELYRADQIIKQDAAQNNDLEKLHQELKEDLEDHMNLRIDELEKLSQRIVDGVSAYLQVKLDVLDGRLGQIEEKIDYAAALSRKCLLLSSKDDYPCPRLILIEEDKLDTAQTTSPSRQLDHFRRKNWDCFSKLESGQTPTRFRLRFVCAHDCRPVACGADGKGYVLEQKDWQRWLQTFLPVFQLSLWLLHVGISVVARVDLLPVDDIVTVLQQVICEKGAGMVERLDLKGQTNSDLDKQVEVYGKSYKELVKFVKKEEENIAEREIDVNSSDVAAQNSGCLPFWCCRGHPASQSTGGSTVPPSESSYERDMVLASRVEGTNVEVAWVHKDNETAWEAAVGSKVLGAAP